jgi:chemotaxis signal transduction protein
MPAHSLGVIEFDGKYIPVIDPSIQFCGEPTKLSTLSCIMIVRHIHKQEILHTGIVIEDIEEVMKLAVGDYKLGAGLGASVNMHFILEIPGNIHANALLAENYNRMANTFSFYASREAATNIA